MLDEVNHVGPRRTLVQQLAEKGVRAEQIEKVLFRYISYLTVGSSADLTQPRPLGSLPTDS
jgi:hypothetical protein